MTITIVRLPVFLKEMGKFPYRPATESILNKMLWHRTITVIIGVEIYRWLLRKEAGGPGGAGKGEGVGDVWEVGKVRSGRMREGVAAGVRR